MKIDYKNLDFIHPKLKHLMDDYETFFGTEQTITSLYRPSGVGVHSVIPVRAADMRCRQDIVGYAVEQYMNERWVYDPQRPSMQVCIFHDTGQGKHIHLQAHKNTVRAL